MVVISLRVPKLFRFEARIERLISPIEYSRDAYATKILFDPSLASAGSNCEDTVLDVKSTRALQVAPLLVEVRKAMLVKLLLNSLES